MIIPFIKIVFFFMIGILFAHLNRKNEQVYNFLNKYLYYFGLPSIILYKISAIKLSSFSFCLIAVNTSAIAVTALILFFLFKIKILSANMAATFIIVSTLGNTVYLGFPASAAFFSENAIAYAAMISSFHNLVIFTFCLLLVKLITEDNYSLSLFINHALKNPVLLSSIIGLCLAVFSIKIDGLVYDILSDISKTVIPLSLITLGWSIYGKNSFGRFFKPVLIACAVKLIILPFICALTFQFCQEITMEFKVSLLEHTMPTAVMALTVTRELALDEEIASKTITVSTVVFFLLLPLYSSIFEILF